MGAIRAVLFDLDGTLVDSNQLHVSVWHSVFASAGSRVSREAIGAQIGKGGDQLVPALLPGTPEGEVDRLSAAHGELFKAQYIGRVRPFPHARDLLARVRELGRMAVLASSASKAELDHYLDLLDARDLVQVTTSIDDVGASKPAPDIFAVAAKKAGVAPDEAIAVGDSPYDMESAGRAGIRGVGLRSGGFDDAALTRAGAVALYDDAADLLRRYDGSPLAG